MTEDLYSEPLGHVLAFALHLKKQRDKFESLDSKVWQDF